MTESIHVITESTNQPTTKKNDGTPPITTPQAWTQTQFNSQRYPSVSLSLLSPYTHQTEERPAKIPNHTHSNPSLSRILQGHLISKPQTTLQCENFVFRLLLPSSQRQTQHQPQMIHMSREKNSTMQPEHPTSIQVPS